MLLLLLLEWVFEEDYFQMKLDLDQVQLLQQLLKQMIL